MTSLFKDLGVGVGLRSHHHSTFLNEKPQSVKWVEVISENYMSFRSGEPSLALQTLKKIRSNYPVFLHGVALNIGSTDALDTNYLSRLKELIQMIEPTHISDHICWTGVQGQNSHDLLPLPYTEESLDLLVQKIDQVQNFLGQRMFFENPSSYLEFKNSTMSEWEFIAELTKRADCGLILDINNVFVSSVNHHFDPLKYLNAIPSERIGQMHLAGHTQRNGYLIDTHDAPVCQEVWDLYRLSIQKFGAKSTMLERDDNIPDWIELEKEILKIQEIRNEERAKPF